MPKGAGLEKLIDLDVERSVLGACLIDPDAIRKVADVLEPGDFHDEGHQVIFKALLDLCWEGAQIDYIVVSRRIGADKLAAVGDGDQRGEIYLIELARRTPTSLNALRYGRIVQRLSTLRRLMLTAGQIARLAYNADGQDIEDVFAQARRLVDSAAPMRTDEAVLLWWDCMDDFFALQIELAAEQAAIEAGEIVSVVDFPWNALKPYIGRVWSGTLVGLMAEPGVGKTAFLECLAEHWAKVNGLHVVFCHLENSRKLMHHRRTARHTGISLRELEKGIITAEMGRIRERIDKWPGAIHYVHSPGWTAARIVNQARLLQDQGWCDVVVVDYWQKVRRIYHDRLLPAQIAGEQIETFKVAAELMGVPWFVASQFNRESRDRGIKTAANARDSGELEDKANLIITLDRQILDAPVTDERGRQIAGVGERSPVTVGRVDKNTMGPVGPFELAFNGPRYLFTDVDRKQEPPI